MSRLRLFFIKRLANYYVNKLIGYEEINISDEYYEMKDRMKRSIKNENLTSSLSYQVPLSATKLEEITEHVLDELKFKLCDDGKWRNNLGFEPHNLLDEIDNNYIIKNTNNDEV